MPSQEITLEDYAKEIGAELNDAYNDIDGQRVRGAIARAKSDLEASNLTPDLVRLFWKLVGEEFRRRPLRFQKAENSALHLLMQEIQAVLEARKG